MSEQKHAPEPIAVTPIVIKKKIVHAGHHGGAWKVAYADFVTAMMALFIVLWLMGASEPVKKSVAGYFRDPSGKKAETGTGQAGVGENLSLGKQDMNQLKQKLEAAMKQAPELEKLKDQVQMTVTGEGLRIELLESEVGSSLKAATRTRRNPEGRC
jgi:chemotaxis protein MotB